MSKVTHHLYGSQVDFSSDQIHEGEPVTEFLQVADRSFDLDFFNDKVTFDDGAEHEIWAFKTPTSGKLFPSPLLRVTEGEMFHATVHPSKKVHTIHWHGLEPDPRNDGVGHTSFEVSGSYTYQWRAEIGRPGNPSFGSAGTYFYHCHVNTPLHVQMGMFGPLIVDPVVHPDFPVTPGARRPFVDGPEYDIETETLLATFSVDPRWHLLGHAAGLSGEDVGLDRFEPAAMYLLGGELATGPQREGPWQLSAIRANAPGGSRKPTLLRLVNANYFPVDMRFTDAAGRPVAMAQLLSHDGRAFRDTSDRLGASPPVADTDHRLMTSILNFGAAERFDVLLRPPAPGQYRLSVALQHWLSSADIVTRVIPIMVA